MCECFRLLIRPIQLQRLEKSPRFSQCFFIFRGGIGISDDARARVEVGGPVFANGRPDENAQLAFAIEP